MSNVGNEGVYGVNNVIIIILFSGEGGGLAQSSKFEWL